MTITDRGRTFQVRSEAEISALYAKCMDLSVTAKARICENPACAQEHLGDGRYCARCEDRAFCWMCDATMEVPLDPQQWPVCDRCRDEYDPTPSELGDTSRGDDPEKIR